MTLEDVAAYLDEFFPFCEQGIHFLELVGLLRFARCGCLQGGINLAKIFLVVVRQDVVSWRIKGLVSPFEIRRIFFDRLMPILQMGSIQRKRLNLQLLLERL